MTTPLTNEAIDTLLTKLGTDDGVRRQFVANPTAALAALGISLTAVMGLAGDTVASGASLDLADKTAFLMARDDLRDNQAKGPFQPITLDFGPTGVGLADKEAFLAARNDLRDLHAKSPFQPITLDIPSSDPLA